MTTDNSNHFLISLGLAHATLLSPCNASNVAKYILIG